MQRNLKEHSFYLKLENELREGILSGALPAGSAIPGELELCRRYELSRTTVRKAIQRLVDRNFLRKVHGAGTFVIPEEERAQLPRQLLKIRMLMPVSSPDVAGLDDFDRDIFLGANSFAQLHDCMIERCRFGMSAEKLLADYHNFLFDGLIWVRAGEPELEGARQLAQNNVPQIMIAREVPRIPGVFFDTSKALDDVAHFLGVLGHRKVGFLDLDSALTVFLERQAEFPKACADHGIEGQVCAAGFFRPDLIEAFLRDFRPGALLCASPMYPYLTEALEKLQWRIPEDLSLILLGPRREENRELPCTELRMPVFDMGFRAAETLLTGDFRTPDSLPHRILSPGEIIVGRSIAQYTQTQDIQRS